MSFSSTRGKAGRHRHQISPIASLAERDKILRAEKNAGCGVGIYAAAAMLAFETFDREQQISIVTSYGDRDTLRNLPIWKIPIPEEIFNRVQSWSFPLFRRSQVTRAACLAFTGLTRAEQREWISEVFVFVGDPRQRSTAS